MIVADTNVLAYVMIEGEFTASARELWKRDPEWRLPTLWRHEFLNLLATTVRQGGMALSDAGALWEEAIGLFSPLEQPVDMGRALRLATEHPISAYDAQFIALAKDLRISCITEDQRLLRLFPDQTRSIRTYLSNS
jgi:predicted nucleic acid-binding protein